MPLFDYQAKTSPRDITRGTVEAENERAAVAKLRRANCHPLWVKPQAGPAARLTFFRNYSLRDIVFFFRQMANLLQAGLPLVKSLNNMITYQSGQRLRSVLKDLRDQIQRGSTLSEALASHPQIFNALEVNVIRAGEITGTLPEVVNRVAEVREQDMVLTQKIRSALAYPLLLITVGAVTLFVLAAYVLPKFVVLFQDLNQELPLLTSVLVRISLWSERYWPWLLSVIALFVIFAVRVLKTEQGRFAVDRLLNTFFLTRPLTVKLQTGKFSRTLASLLESGVPILTALSIAADTMSNLVYRRTLMQVHTHVTQGRQLSEALGMYHLFEQDTVDLIAVGEQGGQMTEMLTRISQMNEREAGRQLESLVFMIEPALILFLGAVIGIIVMAILLPIFEINFIAQ